MFGSVRIETSNGSSAAISSRTVGPCTLGYSDQHLVWLVGRQERWQIVSCAEHWHAVDMLPTLPRSSSMKPIGE